MKIDVYIVMLGRLNGRKKYSPDQVFPTRKEAQDHIDQTIGHLPSYWHAYIVEKVMHVKGD